MMDIVTEYKYSYANSRDIIEGTVQIKDFSPFDVKYCFELTNEKNGALYIPKFLAIYQIQKPLMQTPDENAKRESLEHDFYSNNYWIDYICNIILKERFGKEDILDPDIICIAYNSEIVPPEMARKAFGNGVERVRFSDYRNLPNFSDKNTAETWFILDRLRKASRKGLCSLFEEKKSVEKSLSSKLMQQYKLYGLTRKEYTIFKISTDNITESKIYQPCKTEVEYFLKKITK